jgi:hypothetical protein
MTNLSPKHIVVALLAVATLMIAPFAFPHASHLLVDAPLATDQG